MPFTGNCTWCGKYYSHDFGMLPSEYWIGKKNWLGLRVVTGRTFCSSKCKRDYINEHGLREGES